MRVTIYEFVSMLNATENPFLHIVWIVGIEVQLLSSENCVRYKYGGTPAQKMKVKFYLDLKIE